MTTIEERLASVRSRIDTACLACGRLPSEVSLLAVSKTFPVADVLEAYKAGQLAFGENYIQEAIEKMAALRHIPLQWHCIGPVQSNKTRLVAEHFDWMHTVDRLKIAQRLSDQRPAGMPDLQVCIQVNVDAGVHKSGIAPEEVLALAQAVVRLPRIRLRGLMCIPEPAKDAESARQVFARVADLLGECQQAGLAMDTLSMGMSDDLEAAVAAGSTMVRVGSAIFGARQQKP